jgi:DNA-binding NarL/FixJ family response regulator
MGRMRRALVVDDHPSFRRSARRMLEAAGWEVVGEAGDAADARTAAAELHPDLVLLDVQLPDGDGFDVAGDLTAGADHPAVVLVSTRDAAELDDLARRRGAHGFVAKDRLSASAIEELLADGPTG